MANGLEVTSAFLRRQKASQSSKRPWIGYIKYRDPTDQSKLRQKAKTFDPDTVKTKAQAMSALEEWRAVIANTQAPSNVGAAEYIGRYIDMLEQTATVEPSTVRDYRASLRRVSSGLGGKTLAELSAQDVQSIELAMIEQGLSSSTVGKCHRLLKQVCKHAVAVGDLDKNPCDAVKPPKRASANPNALDAEGRRKALAMLDGMAPNPTSIAAYLSLFSGMRCGEVCALRWRCIDLDAAVIYVKEAIGTGIGGCYLKTPKNDGSRRDIPVAGKLVDVLTEWRRERLSEWQRTRLALGLPATEALFMDTFVVGSLDGEFKTPSVVSREWRTLARAYGLKGTEGNLCTFHDLRHTYATMAIAGGADVKSVSSNLGHANAAMTLNVYASADADAKRRAAEIVGREMEQKPPATVSTLRTGTEG